MTDELLNTFARQLRERLGDHLKQLILFGSRARGDNDPESDYDCLVVVDEVTRDLRRDLYDVAGDALCEHGVVFSVIPVSVQRFTERKYNPLFMNVRKEGVVINIK